MYQYDITCVDRGIIRNYIYAKIHGAELTALRKKRSRRFLRFADDNLHIAETALNRTNTTKEWADGIDFFICGSDQIWNPFYHSTSELAFCSFAPEKTICFSPSFGVSQIPDYRETEYAIWLQKIYRLSVRERAGQKIIRNLTGRHAEVLLDPTMALPVEKWNNFCKKPSVNLPEHYIVCYFLGRVDKKYRRQINEFAREMGLPEVMLFDIMKPEYYAFDPSEVLYTIKNADYVLTDSFHGSVFSILFHKNFYVFNRNEGGSSMGSRLETLLNKFLLRDRIYANVRRDILPEKWELVEDILLIEKKKIKDYIEDAIWS
jgi:hypothetical protein